ncbi:hypothetical protein [Salininema proteolyticum]|uniref:PH domain-containing protein n=1 Tax=Salininema proteolyticum TaxID=1607685 RepID=A0ABV8TW65_9ACTN
MNSEPLILRRRSRVVIGRVLVGISTATTIVIVFGIAVEIVGRRLDPNDAIVALSFSIVLCPYGWLSLIHPRYELHDDHVAVVNTWESRRVAYSLISRAISEEGELVVVLHSGKSLRGAAFTRSSWHAANGDPIAEECANEINRRRTESEPNSGTWVERRADWWNIAITVAPNSVAIVALSVLG